MVDLPRSQRIYLELADLKNAKAVKVRVHRDYVSRIVKIFDDGGVKLAVYKDWNKYKRRWDYHCETLYVLAYDIYLYEQMYNGKYGSGKLKD